MDIDKVKKLYALMPKSVNDRLLGTLNDTAYAKETHEALRIYENKLKEQGIESGYKLSKADATHLLYSVLKEKGFNISSDELSAFQSIYAQGKKTDYRSAAMDFINSDINQEKTQKIIKEKIKEVKKISDSKQDKNIEAPVIENEPIKPTADAKNTSNLEQVTKPNKYQKFVERVTSKSNTGTSPISNTKTTVSNEITKLNKYEAFVKSVVGDKKY